MKINLAFGKSFKSNRTRPVWHGDFRTNRRGRFWQFLTLLFLLLPISTSLNFTFPIKYRKAFVHFCTSWLLTWSSKKHWYFLYSFISLIKMRELYDDTVHPTKRFVPNSSSWGKSKCSFILSMGRVGDNISLKRYLPALSNHKKQWGKPTMKVSHIENRSSSKASKECKSVVPVLGCPKTKTGGWLSISALWIKSLVSLKQRK